MLVTRYELKGVQLFLFSLLGFTPCKACQLLRCMELKEKEEKYQKDIGKLFRKSQKEKVSINFTLKATRQRKAFCRQKIPEITSSGRSLMYTRKSVGSTMEPWGTLAKSSHPEPLKAVYCWVKIKWCQIPDLEFHKFWICEEDQHVTPCWKPWILKS